MTAENKNEERLMQLAKLIKDMKGLLWVSENLKKDGKNEEAKEIGIAIDGLILEMNSRLTIKNYWNKKKNISCYEHPREDTWQSKDRDNQP